MNYLRAVVSVIFLVWLDQYTKYMVVTHLELHTYHPILGDVFGLYYLENQGMAWGMFQNQQIIFLFFTVLVLIAAVYIYIKLLKDTFFRPLNVCLLFLSSGAIGNMIDRMFHGDFLHGGVVDFLYIKCINFPVFNVADMYVTISIFVMVLLLLIKYRNVEFEAVLGRASKKTVCEDEQETVASTISEKEDVAGSDDVSSNDFADHDSKEDITQQNTPIHIDEMFFDEEEEDE